MMCPPKVSRSTIAAQSRGSVKVLVQPLKLSLEAMPTEFFSSRSVRAHQATGLTGLAERAVMKDVVASGRDADSAPVNLRTAANGAIRTSAIRSETSKACVLHQMNQPPPSHGQGRTTRNSLTCAASSGSESALKDLHATPNQHPRLREGPHGSRSSQRTCIRNDSCDQIGNQVRRRTACFDLRMSSAARVSARRRCSRFSDTAVWVLPRIAVRNPRPGHQRSARPG